MLKNKLIYIVLVASVILNMIFLIKWMDGDDEGRLYNSKESLCMDFAQSYLRTIQKTDNADSVSAPDKWAAAIAIESDFYNMCLLDLSKNTLKNYKTSNIERLWREQ